MGHYLANRIKVPHNDACNGRHAWRTREQEKPKIIKKESELQTGKLISDERGKMESHSN